MTNLIIIGMPGCGKSTFGKRLAEQLGMHFVDTDELIEKRFGCALQTVLDRQGLQSFRRIEEEVLSALQVQNCVVSTGGSAVYSEAAMQHLADIGRIVYLHISMKTLLLRVNNSAARGLMKLPSTSLQGLYIERAPLYERWAEVTLHNDWPLTALQFERLRKALYAALASREH